jgi:hypothetical protein
MLAKKANAPMADCIGAFLAYSHSRPGLRGRIFEYPQSVKEIDVQSKCLTDSSNKNPLTRSRPGISRVLVFSLGKQLRRGVLHLLQFLQMQNALYSRSRSSSAEVDFGIAFPHCPAIAEIHWASNPPFKDRPAAGTVSLPLGCYLKLVMKAQHARNRVRAARRRTRGTEGRRSRFPAC